MRTRLSLNLLHRSWRFLLSVARRYRHRLHHLCSSIIHQAAPRLESYTCSLAAEAGSVVYYYYYYYFYPGTQFPGNEKIMLCKEKSSWNGRYSSSSLTKLSCRRMALKRWIKKENLWNKKPISVSPPDWTQSMRPSLEKKVRPDALIGPFI